MATVYENPWFRIEKQGKYHFMIENSAGGVVVIARDSNERILFVEVKRPTKEELILELPRGGSNKYESSLDAAKRELLEETGFMAKSSVWLGTLMPNTAVMQTQVDVVLVETDEKAHTLETDGEVERHLWLSQDDIDRAIESNSIVCGITLAALLKYRVAGRNANV